MAMPEAERKDFFGRQFFPEVTKVVGLDFAPKICGMLLDLDVTELVRCLEDPSALTEAAKEALEALKASGAQ